MTTIKDAQMDRTDPALLERLVDAARNHKMTPEERFEQRVSFVYGMMSHRSGMSKDDVRAALLRQEGRAS